MRLLDYLGGKVDEIGNRFADWLTSNYYRPRQEWNEADYVKNSKDFNPATYGMYITPQIEYSPEMQVAKDYITSGYNGTRVTPKYFDELYVSMPNDETFLRAMAMALSETGLGRDAYNPDGTPKQTNFWGIFPDENKAYDPPVEEMAQTLVKNFGDNAPYSSINFNTLKDYIIGPNGELTPENIETIKAELGRYNWARDKFRGY